MQRFDRGSEPPPSALQGDAAQKSRHALLDFMRQGAERRRQTRVPRASLSLEGDEGVSKALSRLFRNRCAFCEAEVDVRPYRFRPVSEAFPIGKESEPHLYYCWLETAWENLYPICSSCQPDEPHFFPVTSSRCPIPSIGALQLFVNEGHGSWWQPIKELPRLLDPCAAKDFHSALSPRWDGLLVPLSGQGELTIEHFHLNAPSRIDGRAGRYREYWTTLVDSLERVDGVALDQVLAFQEREFGGTWYLLLRRVAQLLASDLKAKPALSPGRLAAYFKSLAKPGIRDLLEATALQLHLTDEKPSQDEVVPSSRHHGVGASLVSITLSNFKAIEALTVDLPQHGHGSDPSESDQSAPSLLVLGENAAGKSSILEAIALTLAEEVARERIRGKADYQRWVLDPLYLGSTRPAAREATIEVELSNGSKRRLTIRGHSFAVSETGAWEAIPIFAYGAFRQFKQAHIKTGADRHISNLFVGSDLPNPEKWLLSLTDERFDMAIRALREILSVEGEFDVVERSFEDQICYVVTSVPGSSARIRTPLHAVSSGFRSVLAMACDVMSGLMNHKAYRDFGSLVTARGVILIDEVEAHLHPRWKMRIMRGLRNALPQMTFVATSHDPLCLRGMNDGEVLVLQRIPGKEAAGQTELPVFVERLHRLPNLSQLRVDQLLTSDFFQLYSTDAPEMDEKLAQMSEWLGRDPNSLAPEARAALEEFQRDLASALPIGSTEAHRIAQEAVAEYLQARRQASDQRARQLRDKAKRRIIEALGGHADA